MLDVQMVVAKSFALIAANRRETMKFEFQKAANFALMPNLVLAQAAIFKKGHQSA